jgi:hypothetical protein
MTDSTAPTMPKPDEGICEFFAAIEQAADIEQKTLESTAESLMSLPLQWLDPADTSADIFGNYKVQLTTVWLTRREAVEKAWLTTSQWQMENWLKHVRAALVPNQYNLDPVAVAQLANIAMDVATPLINPDANGRHVMLKCFADDCDSVQQGKPLEAAKDLPVVARWRDWVSRYCRALVLEMMRLEVEKPLFPQPPHTCVVCYSRNIEVLYKPCLHRAVCAACDRGIYPRRCPLCRSDVQDAVVYCRIVG